MAGDMKTVELAAGALEYLDRGRGRPVVLLHGLLAGAGRWRDVVPALARDARCIVPTLPLGAHRIPMRPHADLSLHGIAWNVAELLDVLGVEDAVVVGHDTGGAIAQHLVTKRPERVAGLVLTPCAAFENALPRDPRYRLALADAVLRAARGVRRDLVKVLRALDARALADVTPRLAGFHRPAVVAWPPDHPLFPFADARRLVEALPDARLEPLAEAEPGALVALVHTFLAGAASSPRG